MATYDLEGKAFQHTAFSTVTVALDDPGRSRVFPGRHQGAKRSMKKRYPYTIDNGNGELLTFIGITQGPDGARVDAEGIAQPGAGAPMHVHHLQEEAGRVITGRLGYQVLGEEEKFAGPGELVVWPAGTPHKWWNAGDTALRTSGWCKPPDNAEFFLSALFESTKSNGGKRPAMFD